MLQPDDIRTTKFKKGLLGYKAADVDSFKETVFRAYSDLLKDYQDTKDKFEKLTASMEETRLKLFELESKVQKAESVSGDDSAEAKRKADQIIKNAEAAAAEIIAKAKAQGEKLENTAKAEAPKPAEEPAKESVSSKFFKKEEDVHTAATNDDDDEIFVGEIEDARKPDRMMIGDGEEEDAGFEFL